LLRLEVWHWGQIKFESVDIYIYFFPVQVLNVPAELQ